MRIFQRWRIKRSRQEVKNAITAYNDAMKNLSTAAEEILRAARKSGLATANIEKAVADIGELAEKAAITTLDLQRGGTHRERQKEKRAGK